MVKGATGTRAASCLRPSVLRVCGVGIGGGQARARARARTDLACRARAAGRARGRGVSWAGRQAARKRAVACRKEATLLVVGNYIIDLDHKDS